jgi:recombinational DNA repair ATPase RecF
VAREQLSGGQSKLLAMTLLLSQFEKLSAAEGSRGVLLIDDMAAELGRSNRDRILDQLPANGAQVFFTATDNHEKHQEMFHVEHGNLSPVL